MRIFSFFFSFLAPSIHIYFSFAARTEKTININWRSPRKAALNICIHTHDIKQQLTKYT